MITTDSSYVKLGITEWMVTRKRRQWRRAKGGKLIENVALWKQLDILTQYFPNLTWAWTKAHVGTELNERVDQLARNEAEKYV
jgi:ribonuclease HI